MLDKLKSMLVDDWARAHRWYSMWGLAIIAVAPQVLNALGPSVTALQSYGLTIPKPMAWAMTVLAVLTALGRLVKQPSSTTSPLTSPNP
jgi:hypothetical protein